jgi:dethiobiotin synthetase
VRAYKPVVTGLDDATGTEGTPWPPDHELLALAAGMDPPLVSPITYRPAVSPHLAAEIAGDRITLDGLLEGARAALAGDDDAAAGEGVADTPARRLLVVEGVGGLLVPFSATLSVRDLAVALGLPIVIAARPGLGTINHTLLTLAAARASGLDVRAVVLTPWSSQPSPLELSNRETIAALGRVDVAVLDHLDGPDLPALARGGEALPWPQWLEPHSPAGGIMERR